MNLLDLIRSAGKNLKWQWLSSAIKKSSTTKRGKGITTVVFGTDITTNQIMREDYVGVILWIPRETWDRRGNKSEFLTIPCCPTKEILRAMSMATMLSDGSNLEMERRYNAIITEVSE